MSFVKKEQTRLKHEGVITDPSATPAERIPITWKLIKEGKHHLLLRRPIGLSCPVRLLQGMNDREIPWQHAIKIAERLKGKNVELTLIKAGDHRLSQPEHLTLLWHKIEEVL